MLLGAPLSNEKRPPHMSWRGSLHRMERLSAQTEALDQFAVASDVGSLEVAQHSLATADQQQQSSTAVVVVFVLTRVLGKVQDATGEHRDLDLWGTGVALFGGVLGHDLGLDGSVQGHAVSPWCVRCAVPRGRFTQALCIRGRLHGRTKVTSAAGQHPNRSVGTSLRRSAPGFTTLIVGRSAVTPRGIGVDAVAADL